MPGIRLRPSLGLKAETALALAILFLCVLPAGRSFADAEPPTESEIKGAYLLNFSRLVTWPDGTYLSEDDPTVVGILGDDPLLEVLEDALETHQPQSRRIVAIRIDSLDQIAQCHVLFASRSTDEKRGHKTRSGDTIPNSSSVLCPSNSKFGIVSPGVFSPGVFRPRPGTSRGGHEGVVSA
ncbi:MAG: YfiR family protein [Candidatus Eisenbacteria bacterium]